jgi:hypothetical protein
MAKHGLAQMDLNFLAIIALLGIIAEPERQIAALLESDQPIELETRLAIARALRGNSKDGAPSLRLSGHGSLRFYRRFRNLREKIALGKEANILAAKLGYTDAVKKVAKDSKPRRGIKTIEEAVTLSRKFDEWLAECGSVDAGSKLRFALEMAFAYALLTDQEPGEAIKPSLARLAALLGDFEAKVIEAKGTKLNP